jgi:hypothetical protein
MAHLRHRALHLAGGARTVCVRRGEAPVECRLRTHQTSARFAEPALARTELAPHVLQLCAKRLHRYLSRTLGFCDQPPDRGDDATRGFRVDPRSRVHLK